MDEGLRNVAVAGAGAGAGVLCLFLYFLLCKCTVHVSTSHALLVVKLIYLLIYNIICNCYLIIQSCNIFLRHLIPILFDIGTEISIRGSAALDMGVLKMVT